VINGYYSGSSTRLIMRACNAAIYSEQDLAIENFEIEITDNLIIESGKVIFSSISLSGN